MPEEDVHIVKAHIFTDNHRLYEGEIGPVSPDYDMAVAWDRLSRGKPEPRDLLLLRHELLESKLEKENDWPLDKAHEEASKQYDWATELEKELGEDGEADGLLQTSNKDKR